MEDFTNIAITLLLAGIATNCAALAGLGALGAIVAVIKDKRLRGSF